LSAQKPEQPADTLSIASFAFSEELCNVIGSQWAVRPSNREGVTAAEPYLLCVEMMFMLPRHPNFESPANTILSSSFNLLMSSRHPRGTSVSQGERDCIFYEMTENKLIPD
jgi:hypothetical protein